MTDTRTETQQALGGRLPLADPGTLNGDAKDLYDDLKRTWVAYAEQLGVKATTEDGALIGPFNAMLLHPAVTVKLNEFQAAEAEDTTLPPRVREMVVIAVGAVWLAGYELYAQVEVARRIGLSDEAVATLSAGGVPEGLAHEEEVAVRLAFALMSHHRVDEALYREAEAIFGTEGLFDLLTVVGEYQTVCSMMALFEVPVPR